MELVASSTTNSTRHHDQDVKQVFEGIGFWQVHLPRSLCLFVLCPSTLPLAFPMYALRTMASLVEQVFQGSLIAVNAYS